MAAPTYDYSGTLIVPAEMFYTWCAQYLPQGPFYTFGKVKLKGDNLEVDYNASNGSVPPPPADAATQPAG